MRSRIAGSVPLAIRIVALPSDISIIAAIFWDDQNFSKQVDWSWKEHPAGQLPEQASELKRF